MIVFEIWVEYIRDLGDKLIVKMMWYIGKVVLVYFGYYCLD